MKVLITGAGGMVARAAIKHCTNIGDQVVALTRTELNISDTELVLSTLENVRPDAVLNCAAYTDVDGAEIDRAACYKANADGPENLALACKKIGVAFVTISTDYVFDGLKTGFYTQSDTPNPQSVYARSKLDGEMRVMNTYERSIIVRSGWIFGEGGTNFLSLMPELLANGKSIQAISDSFGTPTFAADLAKCLRELAGLDQPYIFHAVNSGEGTSYLGFARKVCEIGGFDKNLVEGISMNDLKRPAPRPANSKLKCLFSEKSGLAQMPDWEESVKKFVEGKVKK